MDCKHHYYVFRGRRLVSCDCFCQICHDGRDCICSDCSHDVEVHLDPLYYRKNPTETQPGTPEHACQDCGKEVFRNGNRGRWPLRCPDCKAAKK